MVTVGYADFERIRDNTLEYCGLWDLFTYKPYKSAVGKYFGRKRAQDEKSGYIVGTVYEADDKSVLVAASKDVKIQFLAKNTRAKITFCDLNNGNERTSRMGGSTRVTREEFIRAKQVAFAVIKSHRKK